MLPKICFLHASMFLLLIVLLYFHGSAASMDLLLACFHDSMDLLLPCFHGSAVSMLPWICCLHDSMVLLLPWICCLHDSMDLLLACFHGSMDLLLACFHASVDLLLVCFHGSATSTLLLFCCLHAIIWSCRCYIHPRRGIEPSVLHLVSFPSSGD